MCFDDVALINALLFYYSNLNISAFFMVHCRYLKWPIYGDSKTLILALRGLLIDVHKRVSINVFRSCKSQFTFKKK